MGLTSLGNNKINPFDMGMPSLENNKIILKN